MRKLTDLIQFIKQNPDLNIQEIAIHYGKSVSTINVYISKLRKAGYKVPIKMGRPPLRIN